MTATITPIGTKRPKVIEFFAGIGLARIGLENAGFKVSWANDYEAAKYELYKHHFNDEAHPGDHTFVLGDVNVISADSLPTDATLAWSSSPCTDLSLAGSRGGLQSGESSAFWGFHQILKNMGASRPPVVVLENVTGLATSHGGDDLTAAIRSFNDLGYSVDLLALDARRFIPQSRPRLFLVCAQKLPPRLSDAPSALRPDWVSGFYNDPTLIMHKAEIKEPPELLAEGFGSVVETMPLNDDRWWDSNRTAAFVRSLSPIQRERVTTMEQTSSVKYRTAYRRTRKGVPVWEVRPDDISGCLRTARGGSSKQAVVRLGNKRLHVRWMTPLEYARLMGAGDYNLKGARTGQALFAFGDAVAVPAVTWLAENYLMPLALHQTAAETSTEAKLG